MHKTDQYEMQRHALWGNAILFLCLFLIPIAPVFSAQNPISILSASLEVITPANASHLEKLLEWENAVDATYSFDGEKLAIALDDGTLQVISLADGKVAFSANIDNPQGRRIYISQNDALLLSSGINGFDLWEIATGSRLNHSDTVKSPIVSHNLEAYAFIKDDNLIVYDLQSNTELSRIKVSFPIQKVTFNHNATVLAIIESTNHIAAWEIQIPRKLLDTTFDSDEVTDVEFSLDDTKLFLLSYKLSAQAGQYISRVDTWDVNTNNRSPLIVSNGIFYDAELSNSGSTIMLSGSDNNLQDTLELWNLNTQQKILSFSDVSGRDVVGFDASENLAVIGSGTTTQIRIIDLRSKRLVNTLETKGGALKQEFNLKNNLLLIVTSIYRDGIEHAIVSIWGIPSS